jgi:hypothetical protein
MKKSGSAVPKDIFLSPDYAGVSAVLYGWADEHNNASIPGREFILVHNPQAASPVPRGVLPAGYEFWVENDHLRRVDRSSG